MATDKQVTFDVLRVTQPIGDFYIASMQPQDLVEISYRDVRRLVHERRDVEKYLGIQREIKSKRVKEIKSYIKSPDATFPTSIILAINENCVDYDEKNKKMTLREFVPEEGSSQDKVSYGKIAKIIDGQHRIAGFLDDEENYAFDFMQDKEFEMNVVLFIGADIPQQADIFATVNLAQTKVSKSLVYDLRGLAETSSPYKTCHYVAVALDGHEKSPFYERIKRLGVVTEGRKGETLTQAAFVEALIKFISPKPMEDRNKLLQGQNLEPADEETLLKHPFRNMFIQDRDVEITEILYNYFDAVRIKWPNAWQSTAKKGNLLPKSNAYKALMRYLHRNVYNEAKIEDEIPSSEKFLEYFNHVELKDEDFTSKNFKPGSGGEAAFYRVLTGEKSAAELFEGE